MLTPGVEERRPFGSAAALPVVEPAATDDPEPVAGETMCDPAAPAADDSPSKGTVEPLTAQQLIRLGMSRCIFMFSFGFVDNFVMIVCGEWLDVTFGAALGASAFCAAGIGNTVSDVFGYYTGDAMERVCERLGIGTPPKLTDEQAELPSVMSAQRHGGALGMTIGCLVGMCPLLWMGGHRATVSDSDLELYTDVFDGYKLPIEDMHAIAKLTTLKTAEDGEVIIKAGQKLSSVLLLLDGFLTHTKPDGTPGPGIVAPRTWRVTSQDKPEELSGYCVKHLLNGTKLVDDLAFGRGKKKTGPYPNEVRAKGPVRYYEADLEELTTLCEERPLLERAMCALVRVEKKASAVLKEDLAKLALPLLDSLLRDVLANGIVDCKEREVVDDFCATHGLTKFQRQLALERLGWNDEEWRNGAKGDPHIPGRAPKAG